MRTPIGMFTVFVDPPQSLMFPFDEDIKSPAAREASREASHEAFREPSPMPIDRIKKNLGRRFPPTNAIKGSPQKIIYGFRLI